MTENSPFEHKVIPRHTESTSSSMIACGNWQRGGRPMLLKSQGTSQ